MRQFLADASHELRTPLTSIRGYAELSRLQGGATDSLHRIEVEGTRMSRLVEDLRHLSLADAGKLNLSIDTCDLAVVARDAVDGFQQRALLKGVRLEFSAQRAVLRGDSARLSQVILNLLENALKFCPPAGRITVSVKAQGTAVRLLVQDSGPGVAETMKTQVFERFYHSDTHGSGSGLDLAIVKQLVELHGGTVEVMNAPEGGAVFQVEFRRTHEVVSSFVSA